MKFFSNDAARQGDDTTYDDDRARERAEAEGATVPQQRAGSPWSDAPGRTEDDVRNDADRTVVIDSADSGVADRRKDDLDHPDDVDDLDRRDDRDRTDDVDRTDEDLDRRDDTTDRMADATSDAEPTAEVRNDSADPVDLALDDDDKRTTTYGPDGTVTSSEEQPRAIRDEGTFESPTVVEPATGEKVAEEPAAASAVTNGKPAPAASTSTDRFFPEGDDVADRFRDIQLRFVDNPKEATAEAATLVDEALDKLIATLKSRRSDLASNSDDTEKLRVELRGYRELLNRLTSL